MDYRKTDYAINKGSESIVYKTSEGCCEVTETMLGSEEAFRFWKAWSDADYKVSDREETRHRRHTRALESIYALPSAEAYVTDSCFVDAERREALRLAEGLLSQLTEKTRRRYILYHAYALTYRQIAEAEVLIPWRYIAR